MRCPGCGNEWEAAGKCGGWEMRTGSGCGFSAWRSGPGAVLKYRNIRDRWDWTDVPDGCMAVVGVVS